MIVRICWFLPAARQDARSNNLRDISATLQSELWKCPGGAQ
jgi:hypothetical protein